VLHGVAALVLPFVLSAGADAGSFTVAIDPGHGGSNRGAPTKKAGCFEKRLTLALATQVRRLLAGEKDLKVLLCRNSNVQVPGHGGAVPGS